MLTGEWGPEHIDELVDLLAEVMPAEDLTADEVFTACYDQPGSVLAGDEGVVAIGMGRALDGRNIAAVRLLAVHPDAPAGTSAHHELLDAAESWARDRGASRLELGGALPFPLWPGVDSNSPLGEVASARGYVEHLQFEAHGVPSSFRSDPPADVDVRRAVRDEDVVAVVIAAAAHWPWWSDEIARALEHGTCHVATTIDPTVGELVIGLGCHSITRATWVGPLAVLEAHRRRGVGHALLGQICRDLMIADFPIAEVPEVDPVSFGAFFSAAGSSPVRSYRRIVLDL
jgi:GNAT superfamily N-acetyltransferase